MRRATALLALSGGVGLGMTAGCGNVPPIADYFDAPEAIEAANHIRQGHAKGLETMIAEGLDVNLRGPRGADLLKWSLLSECPDSLDALLAGGARTDHVPAGKYTGKVDQLSLKPVMELAASARDPRYLSLLLRHGGDPDALDIYGHNTIIFEAILNGRIDNVRLLVEAGADIHAREQGSLVTPLHDASTVNYYDIAYYLLEQGADPTLENRWGYSLVDQIKQYKDRGVGDEEMHAWYVKVVERLGLDLEAVTLSPDGAAADRGAPRVSPAPAEAGAVEDPATTHQAVQVFRDSMRSGGEGPEMVVIPAGRFRMGCVSGLECQDDEKPVREVTIPAPFALSAHEVTFEDYDRFTHPEKVNDEGWGRGDRPVINVSWDDAKAYIAWLSSETGAEYRLPSEAEWEYAARAGSETKYSWGNEVILNRANCLHLGSCDDRWAWTAPAGTFGPNAWGLHDMHGNVREWVEDCWNPNYSGAPSDGSAWLSGNCAGHVLRGGSLFDRPVLLRAANRNWNSNGLRVSSWGFRVARTLTH